MKRAIFLLLIIVMCSSCGTSIENRNRRIADSVKAYILRNPENFMPYSHFRIDSCIIDRTDEKLKDKDVWDILAGRADGMQQYFKRRIDSNRKIVDDTIALNHLNELNRRLARNSAADITNANDSEILMQELSKIHKADSELAIDTIESYRYKRAYDSLSMLKANADTASKNYMFSMAHVVWRSKEKHLFYIWMLIDKNYNIIFIDNADASYVNEMLH